MILKTLMIKISQISWGGLRQILYGIFTINIKKIQNLIINNCAII